MTLVVLVVIGALLCFYGIRSISLALLGAGFALGWFIADASGADATTSLIVGVVAALAAFLVVRFVFRASSSVVGFVAGAVIGAKLWSALRSEGTGVVLMLVLIVALAFIGALLAEKYRRRVLLWLTAFGGASLILSGVAQIDALHFLQDPDDGWQQTLMLVIWLAVGVCGWYVQRQLFAEQLGIEAREAREAKANG